MLIRYTRRQSCPAKQADQQTSSLLKLRTQVIGVQAIAQTASKTFAK
jgi:hypothetical protein